MPPYISASLHDGAFESCPPIRIAEHRSVNGRVASVGHQELLGERQLVADARVDMIRRCDHVILVGVVVQAVEEGVECRRMELSASRCPVHGLLGRAVDLQNARFDDHDCVVVIANRVKKVRSVRNNGLVLLTLCDMLVQSLTQLGSHARVVNLLRLCL
eukprot:6213985-Pleurochrysis_carterae.AAC.2